MCEAGYLITYAFLLRYSPKDHRPLEEPSRLANVHIHSPLCWQPNKCLEFFFPTEATHLRHILLRIIFRFMGFAMPSVCVCVCDKISYQ